MENKLKIISIKILLFGKIFFLLSIGLCQPIFAETELYKKTIDDIVEIPITKVDEDGCNILNYDGYVLKISDELTIIALTLEGISDSSFSSFDIVFKNPFVNDIKSKKENQHIKFNVFIDKEKTGVTYLKRNRKIIYFERIPFYIMFSHQFKILKLELICTKEKVWYTGRKITESWTGKKLKRPKFEDGEWKRQLIEKKTIEFIVKPDQIRGLMDKIGHKKFFKYDQH